MIPLNLSNPLLDPVSPDSTGTACVSCSPVFPTAWSNIHPTLLKERQGCGTTALSLHLLIIPPVLLQSPALNSNYIFFFSLRVVAELITTGISSSLSSFLPIKETENFILPGALCTISG